MSPAAAATKPIERTRRSRPVAPRTRAAHPSAAAAATRRATPTAHGKARAAHAKAQPARRPARGITPPAGFAIAVAGRTAGAVSGVAESSLIARLTQGRMWIGLIGFLLAGIVAINVYALSMTAGSAQVSDRADALARENAVLQQKLTRKFSQGRITSAAVGLGFAVPDPDSIAYVRTAAGDAAAAASRLKAGELSVVSGIAAGTILAANEPVAPDPVVEAAAATAALESESGVVAVDPVTGAPVDPAVTAEPAAPAPDPAAAATPESARAPAPETSTDPAAGTGGVATG